MNENDKIEQNIEQKQNIEQNIETILTECDAMLSGHFLLSSGNHSNRYFQCARLLQFPDKSAAVFSVIAQKLRDAKLAGKVDFDVVAGPAIGGIIPAYELARALGIPAIFTERGDDARMALRRGFDSIVKSGTKIIIAEDVITTGKSTLEAAACLTALGAKITASSCIVDRRQDGENPFSWDVFSALKQSAVLYAPDECPLCREGKLPAVKPGSRKI
ncbi:MAG: orotate phosphoribosyltransferase [Treponemataceae bacterium]|nr:MAG: orotate phosphoribosyltransferase [Treponemataceae bacterium]